MSGSEFDPLPLLMRNTGQGVLSRIKYDKEDGRAASVRLIEPKSMVEGASGLLIRSVQIEPKRGVRHFMVRRIIDVQPTDVPLRTTNNQFCAGEVIMTGWSSPNAGEQSGSAVGAVWFVEYANAVREAIDDYQLEDWELGRIKELRNRLNLSLGQLRAVHAYIFAECLTSYAIDGDLDADEEEQIEQVAACLDELGWRPA